MSSQTLDGRRQRSSRSRQNIIQAYLALVRDGDMAPSAARVAERAGVGLRTVFRHFDDMETLYAEMAEQMMAEVQPVLDRPFAADHWRDQLQESIGRRVEVYENVFQVKRLGEANRFRSSFLNRRHKQDLEMERDALTRVLPDQVLNDESLSAALEVALSFSTWRRLREDQDLSVSAARQVIERLVTGLLPSLD